MIKRDAFLYMEPKKTMKNFAQCGTCMMFTGKTCTILGKDIKITAAMSCGLYVPGKPMPEEQGHEMKSLTPKEAGLVNTKVRCENCHHGDKKRGICLMFEKLNEEQSEMFELEEMIDPQGCCNAFITKQKKQVKSIDDLKNIYNEKMSEQGGY